MKIPSLNRTSGFIRLGCLGYIIALGLMLGGCQGIYTALKNRHPLEIAVADYIEKKPSGEWVTLKDAQLNLLEAVHREKRGKITEIFIPVRPKGEAKGAKVHILLSTKDDAIVAALEDLNRSDTSMKDALNAVSRNADKVFVQKDISGLIRFGLDADSKTRFKLEKMDLNLAKDFVILNEGEAPTLLGSLAMLGGGVLVGFVMLLISGRSTSAPSGPASPPPLPPPLPPKY
ncbi:hypothetical protein [Prosthecobacter sp.]|uniref:hypothetical protein n=1 Tax=Prosthecobacter sp. TaxID=1965333 RepID=UPI0037840369